MKPDKGQFVYRAELLYFSATGLPASSWERGM